MIIPPDTEKDPNLFSPSSSRASLSLIDPFDDYEHSIQEPDAAHTRNSAYGYPFGDNLGLTWSRTSIGEPLPPYHPRQPRSRQDGTPAPEGQRPMRERLHRSITQPTVLAIPTHPQPTSDDDSPTPTGPSSSLSLPISATSPSSTVQPASPPEVGSTSKLWESSSSPKTKRRRRLNMPLAGVFTLPPASRKFLKRWKWWFVVLGVLISIGMALLVGLLVGLRVGGARHKPQRPPPYSPWQDNNGQNANTQWSDSSLNLTYIESRDGPSPGDGNVTYYSLFTSMNTSDPLMLLSTPYHNSAVLSTTFFFPLNGTDLPNDLFILTRGLGAWGTVTMVGSDAPEALIDSGNETTIRIDVVMRYQGIQDPNVMVRVGEMTKDDGSRGIGLFTPIQTDGKVTNPYMLDPGQLPTFEIVIRLPPSILNNPGADKVSIPSLYVDLDHMAVRLGDLQGVVDFEYINITTRRGSINAATMAAGTAYLWAAESSVVGAFNVTNNLAINVTDGSIIANVGLYSAAQASVDTQTDVTKRGKSSDATSTIVNDDAPTSQVNTTFVTSEGFINVHFVSQPAHIALQALLATGSGDINLSLNPRYIGPWAIKNQWGDVRLPSPHQSAVQGTDPLGLGRQRAVWLGDIDVPDSSLFSAMGFNETYLPVSPITLSGVAYWADSTEQAVDSRLIGEVVQNSTAARDSAVVVLGSWGDVRVVFDGT